MPMPAKALTFGIVVGEPSGDRLGADLINEIKQQHAQAKFVGIAGPEMLKLGAESLYPMERLTHWGVFGVLRHIPGLIKMRRALIRYFIENPPDVFIGIDAPEFNLDLELALRKHHIKTVHYVSPTIWAWRANRIHKIKKAVDLMLTLFPFEIPYYERAGINACYVGHPLAQQIAHDNDRAAARQQLKLPMHAPIIALLPGSRRSELRHHSHLFLQVAQQCWQQMPQLQFITAMANASCHEIFSQAQQKHTPMLPLTYYEQQARTVMAAADVVLLSSGTATLECALIKRPMVVVYRISPLTYTIGIHLIKVNRFALPNILTGKDLVPEFIQQQATAENIVPALLTQLQDTQQQQLLQQAFTQLHQQLLCPKHSAADAILQLQQKHCCEHEAVDNKSQ